MKFVTITKKANINRKRTRPICRKLIREVRSISHLNSSGTGGFMDADYDLHRAQNALYLMSRGWLDANIRRCPIIRAKCSEF